ncbi:MAG: hypothetical protein M1831_000538 [Alyxoria varia]|nr:MAG: hypothetical protein M1831_000538 [Alyxoria varia]
MAKELLSLPNEIIINVFCKLHTLEDVFMLPHTNKLLQALWTENVPSIYKNVGPRSISCEEYAHQTLADQDGEPKLSLPLSVNHVWRLMENARVVRRAIEQFEGYFIVSLDTDLVHPIEDYEPEKFKGIKLGAGERRRLTRAYYILWSLLLLPHDEQLEGIASLPLNHLYLVGELASISQPVHRTKSLAGGPIPGIPPAPPPPDPRYPGQIVNYGRVPNIGTIETLVAKHISSVWKLLYGPPVKHVFKIFPFQQGFMQFVALWEPWQPVVKSMCRGVGMSPENAAQRGWDESMGCVDSDDEDLAA